MNACSRSFGTFPLKKIKLSYILGKIYTKENPIWALTKKI
jgi:hypothetical protein